MSSAPVAWLPCQLEHGVGRVGGDHPVPGIHQVSGQQPAATSDLDHEAVAVTDRSQEIENPRSTGVGVESEPEMVDERQVVAVIGIACPEARPCPQYRSCRARGPGHASPGTSARRSARLPLLALLRGSTISATCLLTRSRPMSNNDGWTGAGGRTRLWLCIIGPVFEDLDQRRRLVGRQTERRPQIEPCHRLTIDEPSSECQETSIRLPSSRASLNHWRRTPSGWASSTTAHHGPADQPGARGKDFANVLQGLGSRLLRSM